MRTLWVVALAVVIGVATRGTGAVAQDAPAARPQAPETAPTPPAGRRPGNPPIVSPEVHADRTVTFRLRAPNATKVTVSGEWPGGEKPLAKDEQGVWSVTVGPLAPDLYGYGFSVDGFRTLDPSNREVKPMRSPTTSVLEVPGTPPLPHEFVADVPHGAVRVHAYRSKSLDRRRGLYVYTPPGYDQKPAERYPVLYLFHGSGDNEATWTALGRAHFILDNLIAQGKAKPMIVVMTDGHAAAPQPPPAGAGTGGASGAGGDPAARNRNVEAFGRDLLEDVIPFVEGNYRVRAEPKSRAIVGLSMGGGQSLTIGLNHPELFAYVGGMSSAVRQPEVTVGKALSDAKTSNEQFKLIWVACGKDDFLIEANKQFSELLKQRGVRHEFLISEGNHSWPVWRRYLAQFAPLLFQN